VVSLPAGRGSVTPSKGSTFMSHTPNSRTQYLSMYSEMTLEAYA
jgi:hypothetical protein